MTEASVARFQCLRAVDGYCNDSDRRSWVAHHMVTALHTDKRKSRRGEGAHDLATAANRKASGHPLCSDGEMRYLGFDVRGNLSPLIAVDFKDNLDGFASIGHRLLSRVPFGDDFRQRRHQHRVATLGLRVKIDSKLMSVVHDPIMISKTASSYQAHGITSTGGSDG